MPTKPATFGARKGPAPKPSDRADGSRLYDSRDWRDRIRPAVLERDCHLCQECLREGTLNAVDGREAHVDHKTPHRGDPALFFDEDNCETLCHTCHSRKTASGR